MSLLLWSRIVAEIPGWLVLAVGGVCLLARLPAASECASWVCGKANTGEYSNEERVNSDN